MGWGFGDVVSGITKGAGITGGFGAGGILGAKTGGTIGGEIGNMFGSGPSAPDAPGTNPDVAQIHQEQLANARNFRGNMPNMANQMATRLANENNQQLGQTIHNTRVNNSSRGMLYGGVNAGQEAGANARAAVGYAQGRSDINTGLMSNADMLDAQAVGSGIQIQKNSQAIQNDIYAQALARIHGENAMANGFMGAAGMVGGGMLAGA